MYIHFTFKDGSNPHIATTNKALWSMINRYYLTQTSENGFSVDGKFTLWKVHGNKTFSAYERAKEALRDFAIQWQYDLANFAYSYSDLIEYGDFFREYGKKYGLLREFRENGIPC